MKTTIGFPGFGWALCAVGMLVCSGCSQQEAEDAVRQAGETVGDTADAIAQDVDVVVEKGERMASELGENAAAYVASLKEKFGNLQGLKDSPEKLKSTVEDLIVSIENKAQEINLPETVSSTLTSVKEKLVTLRDELEGDIEQAKIDEHIQSILDSVKSGLGMSDQ
jgi:hypothetical protein